MDRCKQRFKLQTLNLALNEGILVLQDTNKNLNLKKILLIRV